MAQSLRGLAVDAGLDRNRVLRAGYRASASALYFARGYRYGRELKAPAASPLRTAPKAPGELEKYCEAHSEGPGMLKWQHYFDIYERHLERFRGQAVNVVEIGVFGGGSLEMWRHYLGEDTHVYGVDINPATRRHQGPGVDIFIGDQGDPAFWARFLERVRCIDIVIDDGGHLPDQQAVTLEALLPHLQPCGVYICEDIHGAFQPFNSMVDGLSRPLNDLMITDPTSPRIAAVGLHSHIGSIHHYPMLTVIEKPASRVDDFTLLRCGTEWPQEAHAQVR